MHLSSQVKPFVYYLLSSTPLPFLCNPLLDLLLSCLSWSCLLLSPTHNSTLIIISEVFFHFLSTSFSVIYPAVLPCLSSVTSFFAYLYLIFLGSFFACLLTVNINPLSCVSSPPQSFRFLLHFPNLPFFSISRFPSSFVHFSTSPFLHLFISCSPSPLLHFYISSFLHFSISPFLYFSIPRFLSPLLHISISRFLLHFPNSQTHSFPTLLSSLTILL